MNLATSHHDALTDACRTIPDDPHKAILGTYFFDYIDRGIGADETPLFTQTFDGRPLSGVIAETFRLPPHEAEEAIESARREVWL